MIHRLSLQPTHRPSIFPCRPAWMCGSWPKVPLPRPAPSRLSGRRGLAVRRRDPWSGKAYEEVLSLDPAHVDLTRLNGGAPLLNTHGAFDLEDVIGVVERAWIAREGGTYVGRATVRFSDRADVEPIWQDVRRRHHPQCLGGLQRPDLRNPRRRGRSSRSGRPSTGSRLSFPPFPLALMVPRASAPIPRQHPVACCGRANPLIPRMKRIPQ